MTLEGKIDNEATKRFHADGGSAAFCLSSLCRLQEYSAKTPDPLRHVIRPELNLLIMIPFSLANSSTFRSEVFQNQHQNPCLILRPRPKSMKRGIIKAFEKMVVVAAVSASPVIRQFFNAPCRPDPPQRVEASYDLQFQLPISVFFVHNLACLMSVFVCGPSELSRKGRNMHKRGWQPWIRSECSLSTIRLSELFNVHCRDQQKSASFLLCVR